MNKVTCAIILQNKKVLCAQRSERMKHPLRWEFPGGKVEGEEDLQSCLMREIQEELNVIIEVGAALKPSKYSYGEGKQIVLHPFICTIVKGEVQAREHKRLEWFGLEEMQGLDWLEADVPIVEEVIKLYSK